MLRYSKRRGRPVGTQFKEVGGGPATGLANDFVKFLQQGLSTGSFGGVSAGQRTAGADPYGSTMGIAGVLNDLLSGGAGNVGGSMAEMISKQGERDVMGLRSRFGVGGGTSLGTPAAYGEAVLRSETAPKITTAVGGLQLQTLSQLLPLFANLAGKGISQRETVAQPNPLVSTIGALAPAIASFGNIYAANQYGKAAGQAGAPPPASIYSLPVIPFNYGNGY